MVFSVIMQREDQESKKHLGSPHELRGNNVLEETGTLS